ncbi:MAG: DUF4160 domain-containing protein [Chitinispirillia bacterium]|nr:DUF4160 domain-containing protein [Chitinispirillia bacterium]
MPTICTFRGIRIYINWHDHLPPHFHAEYAGMSVVIDINDIDILEGQISDKQLKMLLGWAALHQEELLENWELASKGEETFAITPLA